MAEKKHTSEDMKLIKKLFDLMPLDWARYPDGRLSFIAPDGSKATYTEQQLDEMMVKQKPPAKKTKPADKTKTAAASPASQGKAGSLPAEAANAAASASPAKSS